ncbi:MAG: ATP-binding cassette domain-containing protein [Deltaproteobacteria bacterium]|nr:MAG: ATP-binding cassette domain-containing protein [Deltaproteobacteria bacterium]
MIEAFRLGVIARGGTLWDGLDFAFGEGAVWAITGPPSSGKTLLLSILRGDRKPDAGDVLVSGESLYRGGGPTARTFRASRGFIPERFDAETRLTVDALFLRSALAGGGMPGKERREREERLLAMVGLPGVERFALAVLSASERARALLAAELLRNPKALFADGLVAAAGEPYREMLGGLFRALAREGNTIVLAERALPDRWIASAGAGEAVGPFRVHCLHGAKGA